jgi:hypothetical protein
MVEEVLMEVMAEEKEHSRTNGIVFDFTYGSDYANLGFKGIAGPTIAPILQGLESDLPGLIIKDFYGTPVKELPIMADVDSLADYSMIVTIGAGTEGEDVIGVFSPLYPDIPVAVGAWSLVCTKLYPYFDSGQFVGLMDGINGASEYMTIHDPLAGSSRRINSLTLGRSMIILLIIVGNIGMLLERSRRKKGLPVPTPVPPVPGEKHWLNVTMGIFCIGFVVLLIAELIWSMSHGADWTWKRAGMWSAAFCTIGMMSFAFGDNKLYRILEHVIIGSAAAYGLYEVIDKQFIPNFVVKVVGGFQSIGAVSPVINGGAWNLLWLLVLIPSALWFTIYFKQIAWTNKIVVGILMGVTVGISFEKFTNLGIPQILESFKPVIQYTPEGITFNMINLIYITTMVLVLLYFVFCFKRKSATSRGITRLGRVLMMIAFGALFGNTVATRMTWLIDRLETLAAWILSMSFWS